MLIFTDIVNGIFEAIVTYGIVPVILVVIAIFLWKQKQTQNERDKEQAKRAELQDQTNQKMFEMFANFQDTQRKEFHHEHTKEEEEEERHFNNFLSKTIDALLKNTGASRCAFILYHNGGFALTGRSLQRQSMLVEQVDEHTVPQMKGMQSTPRKMLPTFDDVLAKDGKYYIDDVEKLKTDDTPSYCWFSRICGAKAVYAQSVRDTERDLMLGFISLEFNDSKPDNAENIQYALEKTAQNLGGAYSARQSAAKKPGEE